jgi:hypothetical protein
MVCLCVLVALRNTCASKTTSQTRDLNSKAATCEDALEYQITRQSKVGPVNVGNVSWPVLIFNANVYLFEM